MVIVDFANVVRWSDTLSWDVGIKQLAAMVKNFATGSKYLRRFYYGEDYGPSSKSTQLSVWSAQILAKAKYDFEIVSKRVKYIPDSGYKTGFIKKCNLDIEMAMDLIREKDNYDTAILFSGDGDLACVIEYLHTEFQKKFYVFGARDHIGKELVELKEQKKIADILFVEDFEYRLNLRKM